ncbi:YhcB family protein [Entomomonas asaccharolytica]|uniref:Z-ring associated protein G n=1 Tax=Entomomonas asaccharolytica TaxID=2785331 RepID=A0A974NFP8_9GAMM|nr:DUF1043 family protein [Entomomonas asaccharolytica]QQP85659.1 DUF1043 family protein [Entomomonas asaccharolytica]
MMEMGLVVIIAIVAFLVGMFGGFLVSKATGGDRSGNLKNQMESLEERFNDYQNEVASHFNTTANIAQKLSQGYQEMQAHLEHSVESLVADSELRARLISEIKANDQKALDYSAEGAEEENVGEAVTVTAYNDIPRDYAPKAPGEPGTLTEEFAVKHK